jgi:hemolysin III
MDDCPRISVREEIANSISHGLGLILAVVALPVLIVSAIRIGSTHFTVGASIFGATVILLYLASTLYHSINHETAKRFCRLFDHSAIFLLIAGTYTPFTLITLRGAWGWWLFGAIWTLAALGIAKDVFLHGKMRVLSIALYVLMGWLIVIAFGPLRAALPAPGVALLIAGGIVYTIGIGFFAMSKRVAYTHGVWHLFVIAGSICHYVAVLRYVAR